MTPTTLAPEHADPGPEHVGQSVVGAPRAMRYLIRTYGPDRRELAAGVSDDVQALRFRAKELAQEHQTDTMLVLDGEDYGIYHWTRQWDREAWLPARERVAK